MTSEPQIKCTSGCDELASLTVGGCGGSCGGNGYGWMTRRRTGDGRRETWEQRTRDWRLETGDGRRDDRRRELKVIEPPRTEVLEDRCSGGGVAGAKRWLIRIIDLLWCRVQVEGITSLLLLPTGLRSAQDIAGLCQSDWP